jgi:hypothetical protein
MQIKLSSFKSKSKNAIDIKGKNKQVRIITTETEIDDLPDDDNLYVLVQSPEDEHTSLNDKGHLVVCTTGEYEQDEIFISTQVNNVEKKREDEEVVSGKTLQKVLDIVEVEVDGVRVMYFRDDMRIDKDTLNQIGIVDIMIVDVGDNVKQQLKEVNSVDPQIVVPFSVDAGDRYDEFKSEIEIKFSEEKKIKAKQSDFSSEDYVLQGIELKS